MRIDRNAWHDVSELERNAPNGTIAEDADGEIWIKSFDQFSCYADGVVDMDGEFIPYTIIRWGWSEPENIDKVLTGESTELVTEIPETLRKVLDKHSSNSGDSVPDIVSTALAEWLERNTHFSNYNEFYSIDEDE